MPAGRKEADTGGATTVKKMATPGPKVKIVDPKTDAKPATKVELKPVSKTEAKPAAKTEAKAPAKVEAKAPAKAEPKTPAKIETKPPAKVETKTNNTTKPQENAKAQNKIPAATPKTNSEPPKDVIKSTAPKSTVNNIEPKEGNIFGVNLKSVPNPKVKIPIFSDSESDEEYTDEEIEEEEEEEEEEESSTASNSDDESSRSNTSAGDKTPVRTTFRPPWVKEGSNAKAPPSKPWQLTKRGSRDKMKKGADDDDEPHVPAFQMPMLRKVSAGNVKPIQENGSSKEPAFVKPLLKPVPPKESKLQSKEVKIPVKLNPLQERLEREESLRRASLTKQPTLTESDNLEKAIPSLRNALVKQDSLKKIPRAPPMPPPAPAMPKPFDTPTLTETQLRALENLRSRPKTRPDWTAMLKDIEGGKKLRHVKCNDRSQPLLPEAKAKGKFLYESEKANAHNDLLKEIQGGIHLKKVKTNDRSKPILEGLRKFRRQMTIEEQIIKSQSMASISADEVLPDEADEMDDIDKVRDDLQSTKQLLALELRNKEAVERENKKLQARIQHLEAELNKEKSLVKSDTQNGTTNDADSKIIKSLKVEMEEARHQSEEVEKKYTATAEQLDTTKAQLEELKKAKQELEKKLQEALQGKRLSISGRKESILDESEEENFYEDDEVISDGEDTEEKREKRALREVKMLRNKLRSYKTKEENAKKERQILKDLLKKNQADMKEEKKKYKALQKEVNKMAALMKESDEEGEEEEEEDKVESESESESSESESESSEEDSDSEKSQSEPEDAPNDKKKDNLTHRSKRHENILNALKKGNYVLKTNVERLQDDLNKQKEATATLQEDLDSVLSELG